MNEYILIITTCPDKSLARDIANVLVKEKLAACVQEIGPITSTYEWDDAIQNDTEWQLIIKTNQDNFEKIETLITKIHSYEVPEIIAIPIIKANKDYLNWLNQTLLSE